MPVGIVRAGLFLARVRPVHAEVADVGQRIAERAQLPVEHGRRPVRPRCRPGSCRTGSRRGRCDTPCCVGRSAARRRATSSIAGSSRVFDFSHCVRPAPHLPLDVPVALGEVAEADRVDVDRVQIGQHVDQMLARTASLLDAHGCCPVGAVEHDAVDVAHHVERRAVDVDVGAHAHRPRHRDVGTCRPRR